MAQYIDKSALVAEIERRIKELQDLFKEDEKKLDSFQKTAIHLYIEECKMVLNILDTLEVKEVDLEKEYEEFVVDDPIFGNFITNDTMGMELAKHFFELGLKTQHSNINFQNIDDLLEEDGINPDSKEAKIFKESYYMALEKLKEKKGE